MISRKLLPCVVACALLFLVGGRAAQAQLDFFYLETFDDMVIGSEINGQAGWTGLVGYSTIHEVENRGFIGLALESRGAAYGFEEVAESPRFATAPSGNGLDWVLNILVAFDSDANTWYITPKNYSDNTVVTRLKFEAGGTLSILQPDGFGGGDFVPVPGFDWQRNRFYDVFIVVRPSGELFLLINSKTEILFQGDAFATGIESVAFENGNNSGRKHMFIDMVTCANGQIRR